MMVGGLKRGQIAAGVLAGGGGKRFGGRPKGLLKAGPGICIMQKQVAELVRSGMEEVIILANDPRPYRAFGPRIVPDLRPGTGPPPDELRPGFPIMRADSEPPFFCPATCPASQRGR